MYMLCCTGYLEIENRLYLGYNLIVRRINSISEVPALALKIIFK